MWEGWGGRLHVHAIAQISHPGGEAVPLMAFLETGISSSVVGQFGSSSSSSIFIISHKRDVAFITLFPFC